MAKAQVKRNKVERPPAYPQVELKSTITESSIDCRYCGESVDLSENRFRIPAGGFIKVKHKCGNMFKIIDDGDKDH